MKAGKISLDPVTNTSAFPKAAFDELFEAAPAGYLVTDSHGTITEANYAAAALFHVRHDSLVGKPLVVFVAEKDKGNFHDLLNRLQKGYKVGRWEGYMKPRSRPSFPTVFTVSSVRSSDGRLSGLRWFLRDITERKRVEEELRRTRDELEMRVEERTAELAKTNEALRVEIAERKRAEEALHQSEEKLRQQAQELEQQLIASGRLVSAGELAANMAHEFNNPLAIIAWSAHDVLTEVNPSDHHYQTLKIIEEQAERCKNIIRDLLNFARPAHAEMIPQDVKVLVMTSLDIVLAHFQKLSIKTAVDLPSDLPQIRMDVQQLKQVLVNLFLNAMDAMPNGGLLTVRATFNSRPSAHPEPPHPSLSPSQAERIISHSSLSPSEGESIKGEGVISNEIIVAVSDTGIGIDPNDLPNIFRPFFTKKKKRGMGLGLSICERIMKAHNGRISVESRPGQGTTFYLHLPVT